MKNQISSILCFSVVLFLVISFSGVNTFAYNQMLPFGIAAKAKVEKPTASQKSGVYSSPLKITFKNSYSPTTKIYYSTKVYPNPLVIKSLASNTDIKSPADLKSMYKRIKDAVRVWNGEDIIIDNTTTLRAVAIDTDKMSLSSVSTYRYVINKEGSITELKAPVASPSSGTYTKPVTVKFDLTDYTPTTKIYYTYDGSKPSPVSNLYNDSTGIGIGTTVTLKAVAIDQGKGSSISTYSYVLKTPPTPIAAPTGGRYVGTQTVKFDMSGYNNTTKIYYTIDRTTPTESSSLYNDNTGISISSSTVLSAIAIDGELKSGVSIFPYVIITTTTQPNTSNLDAQRQEMLKLINTEREKVGADPLSLDPLLNKVSQLKAEDMAANNYFDHTSPTYGRFFDMMKQFGIKYRAAGENIAMNLSVSGAMNAWMNSSGHRANILSPSYNYLGVGIQKSPVYGTLYVQQFVGR